MSGTLLAERYELEGCVAIGGMGEIWRARDLLLDRRVAVKLIKDQEARDPLAATRFLAEARYGARLRHPGIVQVYDFCDSGRPFLVLELVDGPALAQVLAAGPIEPRRALDVTAQVASALGAAHAAGIIHQDVKPANLLFSRSGAVKLADFGIAQEAGSPTVTGRGTVSGTVAYLAPERIHGDPASPASDLYSLGVVLYECVAGNRPFSGSTAEIAAAHQWQEVPSLPADVPSQVSRLIYQLMAKDPRSRPADARAVARTASRLRDLKFSPGALTNGHELASSRQLIPAIAPTIADGTSPVWMQALLTA
jgi:serine/threonine protein kinase